MDLAVSEACGSRLSLRRKRGGWPAEGVPAGANPTSRSAPRSAGRFRRASRSAKRDGERTPRLGGWGGGRGGPGEGPGGGRGPERKPAPLRRPAGVLAAGATDVRGGGRLALGPVQD